MCTHRSYRPKLAMLVVADECGYVVISVDHPYLQDPMNLAGRNMAAFDHVKKDLRLVSEEEEAKLRV